MYIYIVTLCIMCCSKRGILQGFRKSVVPWVPHYFSQCMSMFQGTTDVVPMWYRTLKTQVFPVYIRHYEYHIYLFSIYFLYHFGTREVVLFTKSQCTSGIPGTTSMWYPCGTESGTLKINCERLYKTCERTFTNTIMQPVLQQ